MGNALPIEAFMEPIEPACDEEGEATGREGCSAAKLRKPAEGAGAGETGKEDICCVRGEGRAGSGGEACCWAVKAFELKEVEAMGRAPSVLVLGREAVEVVERREVGFGREEG